MKKIISSKIGFIGVLILFFGIGLYGYFLYQQHGPQVLEIYSFSMTNGHASLLRTPADQRILVDGGSNSEIIRYLSKILPFYTRRIDMVIVTSPQKKNVNGLVEVLERYQVEQLIISSITLKSLNIDSSEDSSYVELLKVARKKKVSIRMMGAGERIISDGKENRSPVVLNVFFPEVAENFSYSKASFPQLVFDISYGENHFLWLGDASKKIQQYIVSKYSENKNDHHDGNLDVLMVYHSAESSSLHRDLIEILHPEYLIYTQSISRSATMPLFSFDRRFNVKEKTIRVVSDGKKVNIGYLKF